MKYPLKRIQLLIVFFSYTFVAQSQIVYERIYEDYTNGWDVKATNSGDYVLLCEYVDSEDNNHIKPALIKVNENGDIIWERHLESNSWGRFLHITCNQDIIIYTQNITLLDSTGSIVWRINPSEELSDYSSTYFLKIFENSQDTSFLLISREGDLLGLNRKGIILNYHKNPSSYNPIINDAYRDQLNGYWQVGHLSTQLIPAGHKISGAYVAKLDSSFSLKLDTVFEGTQSAVAVNQGINDNIIILVDSLDRAKIIELTEVGSISKTIVHLGNWNFINSNCRIEQIGQKEFLLFGTTVTKVDDTEVLDQSISTGEQIINVDNMFFFTGHVCPDCDEFYPIYYANFSKEVLGFPQIDHAKKTLSNKLQIYPNPVIKNINLEIPAHEYSYTILDLKGSIISFGYNQTGYINVSNLREGIYILIVRTDNELFYNKFMKTTE